MSDSHTLEGLGRKIDDLRSDMDEKFNALPDKYATKDALASTNKELSKKVNLTWFLGIMISILGLQATFAYFIWSKVETINENSQVTREAVANIQGKLEPFDFVIKP